MTSVLIWTLAGAASAQPVPAGSDFQVNSYTTGFQRVLRRPAALPDGGFVAVWHSAGQDGSSYSVHGQRYDGSGARVGGEFQANTYTTGRQYAPIVAADSKGNFVVVWESDFQDGSQYGVFAQRFDAAGNRRGAEFQVNTFTTGYQLATDVAFDGAGNFLVVWIGTDQDGDQGGIYGQRFDSSGVRLGGEFQINTTTTGNQFAPSIGMAPGGSAFVVSWTTPDGDLDGIGAQRFAASGAPAGGEFLVNSATTGAQTLGRVEMADSGSFVVVWRESDGSGLGLFGQRFGPFGERLGGRFQVNTYTSGSQGVFDVAMNSVGDFTVAWLGVPDGAGTGLGARRFAADGTPREPVEFTVSAATMSLQTSSSLLADDVGNLVAMWTDVGRDGDGEGVFAQRFGGLRPIALAVDATGNGVLQANETAQVRPSWINRNGTGQSFGGTLSGFTGPAGATYTLLDGAADYGAVADGATAACSDCYFLSIAATSRPAAHWDAEAVESITPDAQGQRKRWRLHIGDSFGDVTTASPFYRFIETLLHHNVTGGCSPSLYCPAGATTREQMAVFVLVAKEGAGYVPPACTTPVFGDVPASSPFCRWVEELARRGVVSGCGGGNYCPTAAVTRDQMPVFVLRTLDAASSPPACAPPNLYADVPETSPFCRWVEELTRRGVVSGCGGGNYCPASPVTREQMGVFLGVTFGLTLYGPG